MTVYYTDRHTHREIDKYIQMSIDMDGLRTNTYIHSPVFQAVSLTPMSSVCWETQDVPQDPSRIPALPLSPSTYPLS